MCTITEIVYRQRYKSIYFSTKIDNMIRGIQVIVTCWMEGIQKSNHKHYNNNENNKIENKNNM